MIKTCPVCHKEPATIHATLGVLPGISCQEKRSSIKAPTSIEFTSDQIKEDRKKFSKDILQPFRSGEVSREYVEAHGSAGLKLTPDEVKRAVPTTDSYYG